MTNQPSAKSLILSRLALPHSAPEPNAPATNGRANPLGVTAQSVYVEPVYRPDQSTQAGVSGNYYHDGGGSLDVSQIPKTFNAVGRNTRTSPAGASESVGG
jgi:hypothetical protein